MNRPKQSLDLTVYRATTNISSLQAMTLASCCNRISQWRADADLNSKRGGDIYIYRIIFALERYHRPQIAQKNSQQHPIFKKITPPRLSSYPEPAASKHAPLHKTYAIGTRRPCGCSSRASREEGINCVRWQCANSRSDRSSNT